ncbi:MAG: hypothetical protein AAGA85_02175 [Bacteroidota bacterium]
MTKLCLFIGLFFLSLGMSNAQVQEYEANESYPYGRLNPDAPSQLGDYSPLIGLHKCATVMRGASTDWADTVQMDWQFKYIMNGLAVQDEVWKADGVYAGSIRQFNADSARWYVHYYSSGAAPARLQTWEGNLDASGDMVLYSPQTAPNGMDGFYKITFADISEKGFNWQGEWVDPAETISFPLWRIFCESVDR